MKNKFVFVFLFALTFFNAISQSIDIEKYVVFEKNKYKAYCIHKNEIAIIKTDSSFVLVDTLSLIENMKSDILDDGILYWDVFDTFLIQVRLHVDMTGMTHTPVEMFNLNNYSKARHSRYIRPKKSIENGIWPIDGETMRIHFKSESDTFTKGPIFFDFYATRDTFMVFVYCADKNKIDIWNFGKYLLRIDKVLPIEEKEAIGRKKSWELITSIPIEHPFTGPFRIIHTKGRNYLVTREGEIYLVGTSSLKLVDKLPEGPERTLVIDKDLDEVYHIERALLLRDDDKPLRDKLRESAVQILHDH